MSGLFKFFSLGSYTGGGGMKSLSPQNFDCGDFEKTSIKFCDKWITINREFKNKFLELDSWCRINGFCNKINRVDSFVCRYIRGSQDRWSYHSFGQAIDINPTDFPMVSSGAKYTLPFWYDTLLDTAKRLGFRVGRDWSRPYDPQHIEIGSRIYRI